MWQALFEMLGKAFDAARSIFGKRPAVPSEPSAEDAARARAGTIAGGAQYEAGRHAGPR